MDFKFFFFIFFLYPYYKKKKIWALLDSSAYASHSQEYQNFQPIPGLLVVKLICAFDNWKINLQDLNKK